MNLARARARWAAVRVLPAAALSVAAGAESSGVEQQILSVGKRISSRATLNYEQSLGTAESVAKLSFDLTRQLTLVGRVGSDNALDLFYSITWGRPPRGGKRTWARQSARPRPESSLNASHPSGTCRADRDEWDAYRRRLPPCRCSLCPSVRRAGG